ncbi:MAG: GSCFA domain-containing protein, partial [Flexibacteraceae bacterium]
MGNIDLQLRTPLVAKPEKQLFEIGSKFVSIGSCFAETIGSKLIQAEIECLNNSFGTVFNPISLAQLLSNEPLFNFENRFLERDGRYFNYGLPSALQGNSIEQLSAQIELARTTFQERLYDADCLLITLGTALSFNWITDGFPVANNHKQAANLFTKQMLSVEEIVNALIPVLKEIIETNNSIKIIITVSPVRHTRQGLENNFLSKSILRLAIDAIQKEIGESIIYFPSFELLTDDLRDYRFYAEDMVHPSPVAEEYIWQFFQQTFCSSSLQQYIRLSESKQRALAHKPTNTQGLEYMKWQSFIA